MKSIEEIWKEIKRDFNWERVHKTMTHLNWRWASTDNHTVPTIKELQETSKKHIEEVWKNEAGYAIESGGLRACKYNDGVELVFELCSAESYEEEEEELYPINYKGKTYHEEDCADIFNTTYTCKEALNGMNGVYLSDGTWVYPDGTMDEW